MKKLLAAVFAIGLITAAFAQQPNTPTVGSGNTGGKAPTSSTGGEGNYFLDYSTFNIYGPKSFGQWPATPVASASLSGASVTNNIVYSGTTIVKLGAITGGASYTSGTAILSLGAITPGTLYTPGIYSAVPLTGGSGAGAQATITVGPAGTVVGVSLTANGTNSAGYLVADTLSATAASIGGTGSGFSIPVATTGAIYNGVAFTGGSGTGATGNFRVGSAGTAITAVSVVAPGTGYSTSDTLSVAAANVGGTGSGFSIPISTVGPINTQSTAASLNQGILLTWTALSGAVSGAQPISLFEIFVNPDTANNLSGINDITIYHHFGGTGTVGGRSGIGSYLYLDNPTDPTNTNRNYVALFGSVVAATGDNGTDTSAGARGALSGMNPTAQLLGGATNMSELSGGEVNIAARVGSSVKYKNILSLVGGALDAVQGATYDTMLAFSTQLTAGIGYNDAMLIGNMNGQFPLSQGGDVLRTIGGTITNGIDLSNTTITGSAAKFPGGALATPTVAFTTCGANCGWLAPSSGTMQWAINGVDVQDYGVTTASRMTFKERVDLNGNVFSNVGQSIFTQSIISAGSVPTGTTGSCVASSFTGGALAGTFHAAICAGGTIILSSMTAATNGYSCDAQDQTTPADTIKQTASTATSATFLATTVAADVIAYKCMGY